MNVPKPIVRLAYILNRIYWWIFRPIQVGVRAMIIQDGKIVLIKPKYKETWNFPGGGVKKRETLEQAVRREVFEETRIKMNNLDLQDKPCSVKLATLSAATRYSTVRLPGAS